VQANFVVCVFNTLIHITRFVKLPIANKNAMLRYNNVSFAQTMPFTYEEKCLLKFLGKKRTGAQQICSEYHRKKWSVSFVNDLLRNTDETGSVKQKAGSGRRRSVRGQRNILHVSELILSQWDNPGTSSMVLTNWLTCCHALTCSVCVLRTCVHFAIVYQALPWYCDEK